MKTLDLTPHRQLVAQASALRFQGRVVQVVGLSIEVEGLRLPLGEICHLYPERATAGASRITAEVVGFREERLILMPFAETHGVRPGTAVFPSGRGFTVPVGEELLGRVVDGLARPLDGKGPLDTSRIARITDAPPSPLGRQPIRTPLATGVRAIDGLLTTGRGQRVGGPPVAGAYPPSVFALLPRLLERAGTAERGSITGLYTVLAEGDDMQDPIADTVRSILDGHIVLTRQLAQENHYPAIDVLQSVSRLFATLAGAEHQAAAGVVRDALFAYQQARDLINIGAYVPGSNPQIDRALRMQPHIQRFLRQGPDNPTALAETLQYLRAIANEEVSGDAAAA